MPTLPQVVIAGASGFVGVHLRQHLKHCYRCRALTRSDSIVAHPHGDGQTEWRKCDLYSLPQLEDAMAGADYAVYLVHSMLPQSRLVQGNFQDMDLLLADNFVRAAESAGVRHIIYLGGLMPESGKKPLSPHLASRLEVETILRSRPIPVTSLRAGLIFGPGGSSTRMLINIVNRLPVMILPSWSRSTLQTIDIVDILRAFEWCLEDESLWGETYDLASHEPLTYRKIIGKTAAILGKRPLMLDFPLQFLGISCLWVSLFGGVSQQLVRPLLESLKHDLTAKPNPILERLAKDPVTLETSIRKSVNSDGAAVAGPRRATQREDNRLIKKAAKVRSVQRMALPAGWDAGQVADTYAVWLTKAFANIIQVKREDDGVLAFYLAWPGLKLLELKPTPASVNSLQRRAFYITGGVLAREIDPPGRFEFRTFPERSCIIAAIHDFAPRLPWLIYECTQAVVHLCVMRAFGRHLKALAAKQSQ